MVEQGYVGLLFGSVLQTRSGTLDKHADIMSKISLASQVRGREEIVLQLPGGSFLEARF